VLIEGDPGLVRTLGVDGIHVEGDVGDVKAATTALKPDYIVGAGRIASRHDAMSKGELGPDYIFFGPLNGPRDPEQREMARWWAEIMEVPSVLSDPAATAESATAEGSDFIGLGQSVWAAPEGVSARLEAIARALESSP
jgi:thiamine-phosphate pyrophosphorylase